MLVKPCAQPEQFGCRKEYRYTGYAKGYSEESATKSTLECEWKKAEVYEANVSHTNYRMESEYKDHTRHEVNTVYFSVPDEYITDYGNLQGIRAQWYEYVTSPIFVTEDAGAYAALSDYVGVNIGEKNEALKWRGCQSWIGHCVGRNEI